MHIFKDWGVILSSNIAGCTVSDSQAEETCNYKLLWNPNTRRKTQVQLLTVRTLSEGRLISVS